MKQYSPSEELQKKHFDDIASLYDRHYGDRWSQAYRFRFINEPMLAGIDLGGKKVLDAMCGNGETMDYLLALGAEVTALDISEGVLARLRHRWPACQTRCSSILSTGFADGLFDCVTVVGGLHHLHPHVSSAITEVHRLLKPGGYFAFTEPLKGSLPDLARRFWYRCDNLFAANEAAIDLERLKLEFADRFVFVKEVYGGNIAYLPVLNSMVLRVPHWMKEVYSPPLLCLEALFQRIQRRALSCFAVSQWRKRDVTS